MAQFDSRNPYRPLSLLEQKKAKIYGTPTPTQQPSLASLSTEEILNAGKVKPEQQGYANELTLGDLVDSTQATFYTGAGNIADTLKYTSNQIFGTDFNDTTADGWSNPDIANSLAGVRPGVDERGTGLQDASMKALAEKNYWDAAKYALQAAPYTLSKSASFPIELAAGAAITAAGAAAGTAMGGPIGTAAGAVPGLAVLGKKIKGIYDTGKNVVNKYEKFKKLVKSGKSLAKGTIEKASQTSLATADLTGQQINEYRKIHGEDPTPERVGVMAATNAATMMMEADVLKKLFLPKFKNEIAKEVSRTLKGTITHSNLRAVGNRIKDASKKVLAAAGGEAAQEYIQTWQEILVTQVPKDTANGLIDEIKKEVLDPQNQLKAAGGALLGAAAGGTARGAIATPSLATGTAANTVLGTAKTAQKFVQNQVAKSKAKILSTDAAKEIANRNTINKKVAERKIKEIDKTLSIYKNIKNKSQEDLFAADPKLKEMVDTTTKKLKKADEEVDQDKVYKAAIKKRIADLRAQKTEISAATTARTVSDAVKIIGERSYNKAKEKLREVAPEELITTVEQYGKKAVQAVKEIESSTARGMIDHAYRNGDKATKDVITIAKKLSINDLERSAAIIGKRNPKLGKQLKKLAQKKKQAEEFFGLEKNTIITENALPKEVKQVIEKGSIAKEDLAPLGVILHDTSTRILGDHGTVDALEAAVKVYKESKVKNGITEESDNDVLSDTTIKQIEKRIAKARKKLGEKQEKKKENNKKDSKSKEQKSGNTKDSKTAEQRENNKDSKKRKSVIDKLSQVQKDYLVGFASAVATKNEEEIKDFSESIDLFVKKAGIDKNDLQELELIFKDLAANREIRDKFREAVKKRKNTKNEKEQTKDSKELKDDEGIAIKAVQEDNLVDAYETLFPGCNK